MWEFVFFVYGALFCALGMLAIVLTMAIMKRKAAFLLAAAAAITGSLPVFLGLGPWIWNVAKFELAVSLIVGTISLIRTGRYIMLAVFLLPFLAFAVGSWFFGLPRRSYDPSTVYVGAETIALLVSVMSPFLFTLAAVFFAGAFIEKNRQGA